MSRALSLSPGDLIVFEQRSAIGGVYAEHNVARVELVRDRHYTGFPWRMGDRAWDKRRFRIGRDKVIAVLPAQTDAAVVAERLNVLRNQRDMERESANRRYRKRIAENIASLDGGTA
jgi:hypothetical protein